jgi:hypothetical protein
MNSSIAIGGVSSLKQKRPLRAHGRKKDSACSQELLLPDNELPERDILDPAGICVAEWIDEVQSARSLSQQRP